MGKSDLRPHECSSVWDRQYGDCKDKANLLRAMLEYKGIPSWLTLLSTEHAGLIERGSPDYRLFNHCILQVPQSGSFIFCDPTITDGIPGELSGSECDRDVLVIQDDHAKWDHTPSFKGSDLSYAFDLKIRASGELAGWAQVTSTGYYGASFRQSYQNLSKDQVLSHFQEEVRTFFPNANVADVEPFKDALSTGGEADVPLFVIRAYMVLPGVLNQGDALSELRFPTPNQLVPNLKNYKSRAHASYIWTDLEKMEAKIELPAGYGSPALPLPFRYDSSYAHLEAGWKADKDVLTANCVALIKRSYFTPSDMTDLGTPRPICYRGRRRY